MLVTVICSAGAPPPPVAPALAASSSWLHLGSSIVCILVRRQKRLAKQALSVEQSAQSAPGHLADSRYSPDDTAWETVVKKGNKGSKASAAASKSSLTAGQPASAAASQSLQPQYSGLSQTGGTASGVLLPLASHQQPGGVHSHRAKSADPSSVDGGFLAESTTAEHRHKISQDEDSLSTRSSAMDRTLVQQQSKAEGADPATAAQEPPSRAGLPAPAPAAKPSNWAGLLKPPQHQQQQQPGLLQQDWQQEEASSQKAAAPAVSQGAFPQLTTPASVGLENQTPSQHSASELSLSFDKSQGPSLPPSEEVRPCGPASPFVCMGHAHPQRGLTSVDNTASQQPSQLHITQQLHANAAIWGTGLSAATLGGIQLPQQQQISVNPFQAASSAASSAAASSAGLWDPQLALQSAHSSGPPRPSQAPPTKPTVKSALPVNAQPFVPQARLSTSAAQGQRLPFAPQGNQQLAPQAATMSQQHGLPSPFMHSHSFGRTQQPPRSVASAYSSNSYFDSLARPQQQQQPQILGRGFDGNAALQQMQHQRLLQQQQSQQQQQAGLLPRQQQQQQLADIWLQPSVGVQQNGSASRPAGSFASHQQPPGSKGKAAANGPFAAHQPPVSAFQQQQQSPFLQQQFSGLHPQPQGRGNRSGVNGNGNGSQFGAASMNGMPNGHVSSAGTQSEEDELLSGVFAKVWEDNLQVCIVLCMLGSLRSCHKLKGC